MKAVIKKDKIYVGVMEDVIHWNHIPTTEAEIIEDIEDPYVVFVSATNHPLLVGVMAWTEDNALEKACEEFDIEPSDLIGVAQLEF